MNEQAYKPTDKTSWKEMDGLVIVVDTASGAYFSLNKTASAIWQAMASLNNIEQVKKDIKDKFKVEEEILNQDIASCIDSWKSKRLIKKIK